MLSAIALQVRVLAMLANLQEGTFAPPEGHAKTVSAVLGEIVCLMSRSPYHKQLFIAATPLARAPRDSV
jgi:hemolysin-activating ACP:hemolysin acyltransferase